MKCNTPIICLALLTAGMLISGANAQVNPQNLASFLSDDKNMVHAGVANPLEIRRFYSRINYNTAWIQKESAVQVTAFFNEINTCEILGLRKDDYPLKLLHSISDQTAKLSNAADSMEADILITDAALHFFSDILYGNTKPPLDYYGLKDKRDCADIPALLANYLSRNALNLLTVYLSPPIPEVNLMEKKIRWINGIMTGNDYKEPVIISNKISNDNKPLLLKLYHLGIIDSAYNSLPDSTLLLKIKEAQVLFNLAADGQLRPVLIRQLNIPLSVRLQQLNLAINYYRWLYCFTHTGPVIVVNIPAAYMKVYSGDAVLLEMRMVVGKRSTTTPTLSSTVSDVVLYPYWHVPTKIAVKEILPAVKKNPVYINKGNYQLLNRQGNIVDPASIDWHSLSASNFPYIIRQSTGCDNALGLIKLNFYNPFDVYLHDTPSKKLFKNNSRFYSHGCMRMEKPMDLGHLVLKKNRIAIDTLQQKGCLKNLTPIVVKADVQMPVVVWYNPAGVDSAGRVLYFDDVYGKFDWMKSK